MRLHHALWRRRLFDPPAWASLRPAATQQPHSSHTAATPQPHRSDDAPALRPAQVRPARSLCVERDRTFRRPNSTARHTRSSHEVRVYVSSRSFAAAVASIALISACQRGGPGSSPGIASLDSPRRLPTGRTLDPVGTSADLGSMPLAMTLSPDGRKVLVLLNGYREQGVQVVDRATGRVDQTLVQTAAFLGIAFSPDGRTLYV